MSGGRPHAGERRRAPGLAWFCVIAIGAASMADFVPAVAQQGAQRPGRRELDFANRLLRDRRYDLAAEEYEKAIKQAGQGGPEAAEARFGLASARWSLGQYPESRRQFEQFLQQAPKHSGAPTAWFRVGEIAYLLGDLPAALRALETYTSQYPDHRHLDSAWTYLGEVRYRQGDLDGAKQAYEQVLTRFPDGRFLQRARYGLGRALVAKKDYAGAISEFETIVQGGDPDWANKARSQLGMAQMAAGQPRQAITTFEALERSAPQGPLANEARLHRAEALARLERTDEAEALLRPLAALPDGIAPRASYALAGLLLKGKPTDALAVCDAALERFAGSPYEPMLLYQSAEAAVGAGKPDDARARFLKVADGFPKDAWADDAFLRAAELARKGGDLKTARALAASFPERFPQSPRRNQARLIEAQAALGEKDAKAAVALLEPLFADQALAPVLEEPVRLALGMAYREAGDEEKARQVLQAGSRNATRPANPDALYVLAVGYMDQKHFDQAVPALQAYLAEKPRGEVAPDALALLAQAHGELGQAKEANETLERLAAESPGSKALLQARLQLGEKALERKDYEQARTQLKAVADQAGDDVAMAARALWGLGWSQLEAGQSAEAAKTFGERLQLAPNDALAADTALAQAQALDYSGQADRALTAYEEAAKRFASRPRIAALARLARARLLDRLGRHAEAADAFDAYLKDHPEPPDASVPGTDVVLADFGWALLEAGKKPESVALFRKLLEEFPSSPRAADARVVLGEAAHEERRLEEAEKLLVPVVADDTKVGPELVQSALFRLGLVRFDRNDWAGARATFSRLTTQYPDGPFQAKAQFWSAEAAFQAGDTTAAEAEFAALARTVEAAGGERPDWLPTAQLRHVECLVSLQRWEEALTEADALKMSQPGFPALHELEFARGRALAGLARFDEARGAYQAVIEARRDDDFATRSQLMIGETYFHQEKYHDALKEFLRVVYDDHAAGPFKAAALLEAGKIAEKLERWGDAADFYRQLRANYPDDRLAQPAAERLEAIQSKLPR